MKSIERISKIDKQKLSGEHYFESVLEQACICKILSDSDVEKIQLEYLSLLAKQSEKFNNGDSCSIQIEKAQDLLSSIMYTIGLYLKTYENPDDAALALKQNTIDDMFIKGKKIIKRMVTTTKLLHLGIVNHIVNTQNVFYRSTIVDGINGFFKLYYPEFGAHKIHITADYPTYNGVQDLTGIEFIRKYLENIYFENLFCSFFSEDSIHHLLCGFDENYSELIINIYEPVLTSALGCVLVGKDINLELSDSDVSELTRIFENKTKPEIKEILGQALELVKQKLSLKDSLFKYLSDSLPKIASAVKNAEDTKTIDKIFIIPAYPENNPKIEFSYGKKMDNELYRRIIEKIMQCQETQDKVQIIKENIHSLVDLEDILLDAELSDLEINEVLKILTPVEFTALLKKYPYRNDFEMDGLKESEKQLCSCLNNLLFSLPEKQRMMIEKAVSMS
ncbi:MAG: DUF6179 domain-containing protein [Clostridia bacterium]|jgi:hypothetical protein|nr:DUF6179 domain-containing protein [Clostridia bacterium]